MLLLICGIASAQNNGSSKNLKGQVLSNNEAVAFATIAIKGTSIGTVADEKGAFLLKHLPPQGFRLLVSAIGYQTAEVEIDPAQLPELLSITLLSDDMQMNEVVVSADRSEQKRSEAPVVVTSLSPKLFTVAQAVTLSDGLNYAPGLRTENTCQNCGSQQVRMNGLEGAYSQILINSRPIFSGLAGVYGLELIPVNMIERIEVVRGGGSALYGSSAIAGTINLILKEPSKNMFEFGANSSAIGAGTGSTVAADYSANCNASLVSDDHKTGFSMYGFTRMRDPFDANGDGFSELMQLRNTTFGSRLFRRLGNRGKLSFDFFTIQEKRAGGNRFEYPEHERDITESVEHDLKTSAITLDRYCRDLDVWSVYASAQYLNRRSYYGANRSVSDYGATRDLTFNAGTQYKLVQPKNSFVAGIDFIGGYLLDQKLGYADYANAVIENGQIVSMPHTDNTTVSNQNALTAGVFAQYEQRIGALKLVAGLRGDRYRVEDREKADNLKTGSVLSPRLGALYRLSEALQLRLNYSRGYRAPQIYDEDLHVATSGARRVVIVNAPNLKQETSNSLMASVDVTRRVGRLWTSLLLEGFYTMLDNAFMNEVGKPDSVGTVYYTRINAQSTATVRGLNAELRLKTPSRLSANLGFTLQQSFYSQAESQFNQTRMFRTPEQYGFVALDCDVFRHWCISASGNYTGQMLVPYYGTQNPDGELHSTPRFFDCGLKIRHTISAELINMQWYIGIKNLLNAYQTDHDRGINRDPTYMYGPGAPRTLYVGVRFGNLLD